MPTAYMPTAHILWMYHSDSYPLSRVGWHCISQQSCQIAHQNLQIWCNQKKPTEVSHHRKYSIRSQIKELLCICIVMGLDTVKNILALLVIAAIKGRTTPR